MENQLNSFKKAVYVGKTLNNSLETLVREKGITIILRLKNDFNITTLFRENLQAINNIDYLVLDLSAVINSSDTNEIIQNLDKIRQNYTFKIIIIAQGFRKGNQILSACVNMGIYDIVTAKTDSEMYDQLNNCLTGEGMTYGQASQYKLNDLTSNNPNSNIIQTFHDKIRQDVSIGVVGVSRGIGATTWALNLLHFLSDVPNERACLIEANNHKDIKDIGELNQVGDLGIENMPTSSEVRIGGMNCYYDLSKISEITAEKYDFYIYDYGSLDEIDEITLPSFLNKDVKFIISGSTPWQQKYLFNAWNKLGTSSDQTAKYFVFNFTDEKDRQSIRNQMGTFNIYFNEYQPSFAEQKSKSYLESIMQRYITGVSFEDLNKKKKFDFELNKIFKKKK